MPVTYLYPDGTDLNQSNAWTNESASSANPHLSIDEDPNDGDTTYASCNSSGGARDLRITFGQMPDVVSIQTITVEVRARTDGGGGGTNTWTPFAYIGGTEYSLSNYSITSTSYADFSSTWANNPATSNPWTQADLNALIFGVEQATAATAQARATRIRIAVTYTPISGDIGIVRFFSSLFLRMFRRLIGTFNSPVPIWFLDNELGDDFSVVHPAGPHPQGLGWRFQPTSERQLFRLRETTLDLNAMIVTPLADDRRDFLCSFWETFEAIRTSLGEDGNIQLHAGGTIAMNRAGDMYDADPGSYLVSRYGAGIKALVDHGSAASPARGMVIEDVRTNYFRRASFINGTTGWSSGGGGGLGGTIAAETPTDPLFAPEVSNNCLKITHGDASAAHTVTSPDAPSSVTISGVHRISIDHRDDSGADFTWRLRRTSDTFFYRDDTGVWQAGTVDNTVTASTTRTRYVSKPIDFGGATAFNMTYRQPSGGAANRVNRLYHVQLENGYAVTSRIPTTTDPVARALATYAYGHTTTKRALLVTNGTWQGKWVPFFSSSDVSSGTITIWEIVFDANNHLRLQYNAATGNLEFQIRASGTTTTATKSVTLTRGTEVDLAVRWTSTAAELGLTARTHSVFAAGVKGTDATRAADPTEGSASLYMGGSSTVGANGKLRRWQWTPVCRRDEEIARGTP
jgi:hypothetical protein